MLTPHRDVEVLHHAGGVFGGSCQMLTVAEHALDVIILTNGAAVNPVEVATQIVDIVLGDVVLAQARRAVADGRARLLGRYHSRTSGTYCVIGDHDGQLNASFQNVQQMPQALIETEAGLRVNDGTGRALLIKPRASTAAARVTAIELVDCGHAETLERLPDHAPSLSDASAVPAGVS